MKPDELVSIIVPIYNSERHLEKAIKSITNQSYHNLEIICIDDGSTDKSLEILERLSNKDSRIRIVSQEHEGISASRLNGVMNINGDFFMFVDSDDWIEDDMVRTLLGGFETDDISIVVCAYYKFFEDVDTFCGCEFLGEEDLFDKNQMIEMAFNREKYRGFTAWLWNKMYKRKILDDDVLDAFKQEFNNGEDVAFVTNYILKSSCGRYINKPMYHYRQKAKDAFGKIKPDFLEWEDEGLLSYEYAIRKLEEVGGYEEQLIWLKRFHCYHAIIYLKKVIEINDKKRIERVRCKVKEYLSEYEMTNVEFPERIRDVKKLL